MPNVLHTLPLPDDAEGNECRVRLLYPEYEPLPAADVERVQKMAVSLPSTPHIECVTAVTLKQPNLQVSVCPIVLQDGSYRRLLSYKLEIDVDEKNKITKTNSYIYTDYLIKYLPTWQRDREMSYTQAKNQR